MCPLQSVVDQGWKRRLKSLLALQDGRFLLCTWHGAGEALGKDQTQSVNKHLCQGIKHFSSPSHYTLFAITSDNWPFPIKKRKWGWILGGFATKKGFWRVLVHNQKSLDYVGLIDGVPQPSDGYYLGVFSQPRLWGQAQPPCHGQAIFISQGGRIGAGIQWVTAGQLSSSNTSPVPLAGEKHVVSSFSALLHAEQLAAPASKVINCKHLLGNDLILNKS